jgi:hypothetical protein
MKLLRAQFVKSQGKEYLASGGGHSPASFEPGALTESKSADYGRSAKFVPKNIFRDIFILTDRMWYFSSLGSIASCAMLLRV